MAKKIRRTDITIKEGKVTVKESKIKILDPSVDPEYCDMLDRSFADIEAGRVSKRFTLEDLQSELNSLREE